MPDHVGAHNNLGIELARRGQVDEAIAHFRKVLEINPNDAEAHMAPGNVLLGRRQFVASLDYYRRALEIKPDQADAHYNLGLALAGLGRVEDAIVEYRKAVEMTPTLLKLKSTLRTPCLPAGIFPGGHRGLLKGRKSRAYSAGALQPRPCAGHARKGRRGNFALPQGRGN